MAGTKIACSAGMRTENINSQRFVLDQKALSSLQGKLQSDPQAGLKQAAQQFEALMLQMMLKSMRDATPQEGMFESDQSRFFTSIFDQQLAQDLSGKSVLGFAKLIETQMKQATSSVMPEIPNLPLEAFQQAIVQGQAAKLAASTGAPRVRSADSAEADQALSSYAALSLKNNGSNEYVNRIWPHAADAAKSIGVPTHFLVAHSALESGWGKHEIRLPDGSPSHNLFGIKAGKSWKGKAVEVQTTEYVNGEAQQMREKFRVYGSYQEAFQDYANTLRGNPRFSSVLGQQNGASFARSLQESGYATDPKYADKLSQIIHGNTLRLAIND